MDTPYRETPIDPHARVALPVLVKRDSTSPTGVAYLAPVEVRAVVSGHAWAGGVEGDRCVVVLAGGGTNETLVWYVALSPEACRARLGLAAPRGAG